MATWEWSCPLDFIRPKVLDIILREQDRETAATTASKEHGLTRMDAPNLEEAWPDDQRVDNKIWRELYKAESMRVCT
jgi:hypothetical protein